MATMELTRLDLRIPRKKKDYFEQVLEVGGFRSLTDLGDSQPDDLPAIKNSYSKRL